MNNILNSAAYEDIADWVILYKEDLIKFIKNFDLFRKDGIIYCKTDFTPNLFEHLKLSNRKYTLISHHSDYPITKERFDEKPSCIKKWYAINAVYDHPDLIGIPLGTKTPKGRAYHESQYKIEWFKDNIEKLSCSNKGFDKIKRNKVYCNWGDTNKSRYKILTDLNIGYFKSHPIPFIDYCEEMAMFKFIISPPGNGIDCHRTWEALYMNCYPIVIKNKIYDDWKELPIIQVNDYSEVNTELIEKYFDKEFDKSKLYSDYWIKRIKGYGTV